MLDKSIAFQTISLVLKRDILPNLTDETAKEQTIAILSLLKNLDANTVPNNEPFKTVNVLLVKGLGEILKNAATLASHNQVNIFQEELDTIVKINQSERKKWETLNKLFCNIVHFVYQNKGYHSLIPVIRQTLRQQLEIERKMVY